MTKTNNLNDQGKSIRVIQNGMVSRIRTKGGGSVFQSDALLNAVDLAISPGSNGSMEIYVVEKEARRVRCFRPCLGPDDDDDDDDDDGGGLMACCTLPRS